MGNLYQWDREMKTTNQTKGSYKFATNSPHLEMTLLGLRGILISGYHLDLFIEFCINDQGVGNSGGLAKCTTVKVNFVELKTCSGDIYIVFQLFGIIVHASEIQIFNPLYLSFRWVHGMDVYILCFLHYY
jgi:hypothetical protein